METETKDESLEFRLKKLIVEALILEDLKPEDIETEAPLFVEGLGLDSIDALELALAIHQEFGVRTTQGDERNREIFHSVKSLAAFIRAENPALASA
ncbi:MAG TPA: phosphopantetheine-binding protein [Polyangiales bacterium]|nr:phosphopantetheine-binding protein [Polyangiales bacterium]